MYRSWREGVRQDSVLNDGDGLRQSKTVTGTTTAFSWDQSGSLPLLLQAGTTNYVAGPDGHPIEQIDGSGNPSYYLYDQLGNVKGLVNQAGTVTDSYTYDVYGARTAVIGSTADTPFGFAGEYTDIGTGFQYLQARYYDSATGQFLTADPAFALTGQRYAYASGDPLTGTDPLGLADHCQPAQDGNVLKRLWTSVTSTGCSIGTVVVDAGGEGWHIVKGIGQTGADAAGTAYNSSFVCLYDQATCLRQLGEDRSAVGATGQEAQYFLAHPGDSLGIIGHGFFDPINLAVHCDEYGKAFTDIFALETLIVSPEDAAAVTRFVADAPRNAIRTLEGSAGDTVSLYKAPQSGLGAEQFIHGYKAANFPGDGAYFAKELQLAEHWAYHYGEGVIEVVIPVEDYIRHFVTHEWPYPDNPKFTEVVIPPGKLRHLNAYPRYWYFPLFRPNWIDPLG